MNNKIISTYSANNMQNRDVEISSGENARRLNSFIIHGELYILQCTICTITISNDAESETRSVYNAVNSRIRMLTRLAC